MILTPEQTHTYINWLTYPAWATSHPPRIALYAGIDFLGAASSPDLVIELFDLEWALCKQRIRVEKERLASSWHSRVLWGLWSMALASDIHQTGGCCLEKARPPVLSWGDRTAVTKRCVYVCVSVKPREFLSLWDWNSERKEVSRSGKGSLGWCMILEEDK